MQTYEASAVSNAVSSNDAPFLKKPRLKLRKLRTLDRKSTRLNSSHLVISYAVFCLKKKKKQDAHLFYLPDVPDFTSLNQPHESSVSTHPASSQKSYCVTRRLTDLESLRCNRGSASD